MDETVNVSGHKPMKYWVDLIRIICPVGQLETRKRLELVQRLMVDGGKIPPHMIPKGKKILAMNSFELDSTPDGTTWLISVSG